MARTNYKFEIQRNRDMLSAERGWRIDSSCAFGLESLATAGLVAIPAGALTLFEDPRNAAVAFIASSAISLYAVIKTNLVEGMVDCLNSILIGTRNIAHYNQQIGGLQTQLALSYDRDDREFS